MEVINRLCTSPGGAVAEPLHNQVITTVFVTISQTFVALIITPLHSIEHDFNHSHKLKSFKIT
jgi:hypothetical protein